MTNDQRQALAKLRFNSVETPNDVWRTSPSHVDGLHRRAEDRISASVQDALESEDSSPIGLTLQGRKGVGKTHLLGSTRQLVQHRGGYFFLVDLTTGAGFWDDVARGMRNELWRKDDRGELQLIELLRRLCDMAAVPEERTDAILGGRPVDEAILDDFVASLRTVDLQVAAECGDVVRALALYASGGNRTTTGKDYLSGWKEDKDGRREQFGIDPEPKPPREIVADLSRVIALTGPSVIAIDQLDTLVAKSSATFDVRSSDPELAAELALIADGLMDLRQVTRRTLSIVSCLPDTWAMLDSVAPDTVKDRFKNTPILGSIVDPGLARELVAKWLAVSYRSLDFTPPHPTWPVASRAFDDPWTARTPRQLLTRIQDHAESCLRGEIRELPSFDEPEPEPEPAPVAGPEPNFMAEFDRQFARLRQEADVARALAPKTVDDIMPALLTAAVRSYITEVGNDDKSWTPEPPPDDSGQLHAGLRRVLDEELNEVERWLFRAIASQHGNAVLRRVRDAKQASGIRDGARNLHLVLIHHGTGGWTGVTTQAEVAGVTNLNGDWVEISEGDVRTFWALRELIGRQSYELLNWLVARKPASGTDFLRAVLPDRAETGDGVGDGGSRPPPGVGDVVLGVGGEVSLPLEVLRKHVVVFAGSGAGKTVLLRRIVEECALRGVSAIVLDPNNDLARLGDPWPEPPEGWRPGDAASAAAYLAGTEVVVWTPGRAAGRPLTFHPLPDFAVVRDDPDEFAAAVAAAVAGLVPHAGVAGSAKAAVRGRAVLHEALTHYARTGGRDLAGFIEVLADLPDGVSRLATGPKMAVDLAETLRAAMVNDPLLAGAGEPVDPAALLTPSPGKKARVSVINFVGLPGDAQRQGFIGRLQLEVFAWIKRHPAVDRPLTGLFVLDEAQTIAPSGAWTASTQSTILLASQARKYGLGLVLATQAPKGVHNQVTGNATTQFFGRLNSPAQIAAANDLARAKGRTAADVGRLERGQFYVTSEAFAFRRMRAPLCLSHHPPGPLRTDEVLDRARGRGPA